MSPDSSFNTAVSFATNTNWQGYGGETTMSYLTQMLGLARAELRVGRDRHGRAGRADPRLRAPADATTIGNFWVDLTRSDALHPAAAVARARARARVAGRRADASTPYARPSTLARADDDGRRRASRRSPSRSLAARPGRVADRDQAARHERRRLLQRELGASVREPDAAVELPRGARDPADPGGALLHVRRAWSATRGRAGRCSPRCS